MENQKPTILFVCIGNICRSPMAKALAQQFFGDSVRVESAGVSACAGLNATAQAIEVLADRGVDLKDHCAENISNLKRRHWTIIVAMTPQIGAMIKASRSVRADHFVIWNVADPYLESVEVYKRCAENISELLPTLRDLIEKDKVE